MSCSPQAEKAAVLVQFYAPWCFWSQKLTPLLPVSVPTSIHSSVCQRIVCVLTCHVSKLCSAQAEKAVTRLEADSRLFLSLSTPLFTAVCVTMVFTC